VASNRSCYTFTFINGLVGWIFFDFFKVFLAMLSLPHGNLPSRGIAALIEQAIVEVHSQFANVKRRDSFSWKAHSEWDGKEKGPPALRRQPSVIQTAVLPGYPE